MSELILNKDRLYEYSYMVPLVSFVAVSDNKKLVERLIDEIKVYNEKIYEENYNKLKLFHLFYKELYVERHYFLSVCGMIIRYTFQRGNEFNILNNDCIINICQYLELKDLDNLKYVSKSFFKLLSKTNGNTYLQLLKFRYPNRYEYNYDYHKVYQAYLNYNNQDNPITKYVIEYHIFKVCECIIDDRDTCKNIRVLIHEIQNINPKHKLIRIIIERILEFISDNLNVLSVLDIKVYPDTFAHLVYYSLENGLNLHEKIIKISVLFQFKTSTVSSDISSILFYKNVPLLKLFSDILKNYGISKGIIITKYMFLRYMDNIDISLQGLCELIEYDEVTNFDELVVDGIIYTDLRYYFEDLDFIITKWISIINKETINEIIFKNIKNGCISLIDFNVLLKKLYF